MKKTKSLVLFTLLSVVACGQYDSIFHPSAFKKFRGMMHSNKYKPDKGEQPFMEASARTIFPLDVKNNPTIYVDTPVHWLGIVRDVVIQDDNEFSTVLFTLDQKYWDYIEDYSVQDEVMFVSPIGEGNFHMAVRLKLTEEEKQRLKNMPNDKALFLCYGRVTTDPELPAMKGQYVKTVEHKYYSTDIFSYKVKRDADGKVVVDKKGGTEMEDFQILRVAGKGQNKN